MAIVLSQTLERALRSITDPHIFRRGVGYYESGFVSVWSMRAQGKRVLACQGTVEGSDEYKTLLHFDVGSGEITQAECSCPYALGCKHIVALGLCLEEFFTMYESGGGIAMQGKSSADAALLRDGIITFSKAYTDDAFVPDEALDTVESGTDGERDQLLKELERFGIARDALPAELITELLSHKRPREAPNARARKSNTKTPHRAAPKVVTPKEQAASKYCIRFDTDLTPQLHHRGTIYMQASIKAALADSDLTPAQKELLTGIRTGIFDAQKNPDRDLAHLVDVVDKSGFVAFMDHSYTLNPVTFAVADGQKIEATIRYEAQTFYDTPVKHHFFLEVSPRYWGKERYAYGPVFAAGKGHVAHMRGTTVTLYQMPPDLARIFARARKITMYENDGLRSSRGRVSYSAELSGYDIWRLDTLFQDMAEYCDLTAPLPVVTALDRATKADPVFAVDYDRALQTVTVMPQIDYGSMQQNVSESVFLSTAGGRKHFALRRNWNEEERTHRVVYENGVLRIAPIHKEKEIALFRKIYERADTLGFTKGLRSNIKGKVAVLDYIKTIWPALKGFAEKSGYRVVFLRDRIAYESAAFTADFSIDADTKNDWLYFDVACYCGGEKLTLADVVAFVESGDTVFYRADGTMVEITNREELERLVAMLKSFEARENGFAGKLYHASELQYVATSSEHYSSAQAKSFSQFRKRMERGKPVKAVRVPAQLQKVLRPYQKTGVHWLHFLQSYRFAGILADDMGLGKTIQTIAMLSMMQAPGTPSLIVCPKTLLYNWHAELLKFAPNLKPLVYDGTPGERKVLAREFNRHDVIIASYNILKQDKKVFTGAERAFNYAVLDEAQFIKNHATKSAQAVKQINAGYRLALTGTPLENSVSEIWSMFDFLMPGFLGHYEHFSKHFHKPIMEKGDLAALEHLRRKIAPFMLRRTKSEVLSELPEKIEQEVVCELGTSQNVLYQQILAQVRGEIFAAVESRGFKNAQIHILAGLMKLRQACNHPALLLDKDHKGKETYESAKLDLALELVEEAVNGKHKVLIFSQFTTMLDILAEELSGRNIAYAYLSGKTRNRAQVVEQFNTDPAIPVFLLSLKAGGTGLNLTAADTVIIFDPWWNPSVEAQAADRAHRIGQTKKVHVYRLLTKGTIEEKIQALKTKKKTLADAVVGNSGDLFKKLTWDDVRELFV